MSGSCRVCSAHKVRRRLLPQNDEKKSRARKTMERFALIAVAISGSKARREMRNHDTVHCFIISLSGKDKDAKKDGETVELIKKKFLQLEFTRANVLKNLKNVN